jgi:hypothetical protein
MLSSAGLNTSQSQTYQASPRACECACVGRRGRALEWQRTKSNVAIRDTAKRPHCGLAVRKSDTKYILDEEFKWPTELRLPSRADRARVTRAGRRGGPETSTARSSMESLLRACGPQPPKSTVIASSSSMKRTGRSNILTPPFWNRSSRSRAARARGRLTVSSPPKSTAIANNSSTRPAGSGVRKVRRLQAHGARWRPPSGAPPRRQEACDELETGLADIEKSALRPAAAPASAAAGRFGGMLRRALRNARDRWSCRTRDLPVDLALAGTRLNCSAIHKLHRPNPRTNSPSEIYD